jgi:hypothetical protein
MYKSSWGWTLGCSKHVEDTIIKLQHKCKKCAFCWFLLHRYITMHFSKNVMLTVNLFPPRICRLPWKFYVHVFYYNSLVNLILQNLCGLPTSWTPEVTSTWWTLTSPRFLCHCAFLPLCRKVTRYAVRAKGILLEVEHKQWKMEPWSETCSGYVEWLQSELCRVNTFTPRLVYCSRFTVTTSYRTVSDQYYGSRSYSVCRRFVPLWNPKVRLHSLWPCTEPGGSSLNLHTLFIYIYISVSRR